MPGAAIPVAAVSRIPLDLVQHGVQPVGFRHALVALRRVVGLVPSALQRGVHRMDQFVSLNVVAFVHVSQPFALSSQAGHVPHP